VLYCGGAERGLKQGRAGCDGGVWNAFFFPKSTPAPIIKRLHDAAVGTMDTPAVQARMRDIGAEFVAHERRSPESLQKFVASEIEKWAGPIKTLGMTAEWPDPHVRQPVCPGCGAARSAP
jgi:tripartite-type tricarboxylate transporter receptor subunit TctC